MSILSPVSVSIYRSCWKAPDRLSIPPQQKQQELKRVEKWLKMVKNWDKYRNSEKVCEAFHPVLTSLPLFHVPQYILYYFLFLFKEVFSILLLPDTFSQQECDCMIKLYTLLYKTTCPKSPSFLEAVCLNMESFCGSFACVFSW